MAWGGCPLGSHRFLQLLLFLQGHWFLRQSLLAGCLREQGRCREGLRCLEQGIREGRISWVTCIQWQWSTYVMILVTSQKFIAKWYPTSDTLNLVVLLVTFYWKIGKITRISHCHKQLQFLFYDLFDVKLLDKTTRMMLWQGIIQQSSKYFEHHRFPYVTVALQ